ncbi:pentapeptide repeat-containing protein [Nostoc sp.]|uniref:pentapeptide repeat-containing protein n=1 Tax=Nostoc sp. TaxID=1180 RepID=UPI002FF4D502
MPPDYSGRNLRGRSFKGQNLTGANFSKADIRGANFTNAILKDADFTGAKAGLQKRWVIGLLIVVLLLSAVSGFFSIVIGVSITYFLDPKNTQNFVAGVVCPVMVVVFVIVTIRKGLTAGLGAAAGAFTFAGAGAVVAAAAAVAVTVVSVALVAVAAAAGAAAGAEAAAVALALAGAEAAAGAVAVAVAVALALAKAKAGVGAGAGTVAGAVALAGAFTLFTAYIGWHSLAGNEKDAWVRSFALAFAATGGTRFRNADLTDADFSNATLKNTDFRNTNLTRTRFYEAKKLDLARVGKTILAKRNILNLLVTGNGRGKSYAGANLKGANLIGADLKEANLKDAYISKATFQGACLEWANLTLTQAINTDFTSAKMTGACVEAWNIESTTKLDNVDCRFIYLLEHSKPKTDDRERRPSSGEFQPGEFSKLFEEVLNTVDLIFRNGIDWKAFVNAFQSMQNQNEDRELALQSIENKGDGVVVVKVGVPDGADKEKIHSDFTQSYQLALQAVEEKYKAQLQAKDEQIVVYRQQSGEMTEIVKLLANKPINVQVDNKVENKNMTNSNDSSRNINVGRDFNASGQAFSLGDISGAVTNTINELPKSSEADKPGIKELLTQLQAAIEADTNLSKEDKAEALEQVKALAEAGKSPQEGAMQKAAKTAIKILKGTISSLPSATKLVEQCSNLLPLISTFLGLG